MINMIVLLTLNLTQNLSRLTGWATYILHVKKGFGINLLLLL